MLSTMLGISHLGCSVLGLVHLEGDGHVGEMFEEEWAGRLINKILYKR